MTVFIFVASLLAAMALGMPLAFSLVVSGVALMLHMDNFDTQIVSQNLINGADNFPLMAVPFFMLAGELMNAGGMSRRIVNSAMVWVGHFQGGLGYVAVFAAIIMASLSGSAVADTAALAAVLMPMMRDAGYRMDRSAGLIAAGGIIAPVIPPSIGFILFGVIGGVSISKLFMAGIFPGILMGLALIAGVTKSALVNNVIVSLKVCIVLLVIGFGFAHVDPSLWHPFVPAEVPATATEPLQPPLPQRSTGRRFSTARSTEWAACW